LKTLLEGNISGITPVFAPITGVPQAIASIATRHIASEPNDGTTNKSAALYTLSISILKGIKVVMSAILFSLTSFQLILSSIHYQHQLLLILLFFIMEVI